MKNTAARKLTAVLIAAVFATVSLASASGPHGFGTMLQTTDLLLIADK